MSPDEFDPAIERLFSRGPEFNDSVLFNAKVMGRLNSSSRVRNIVLTCAGVLGGVVALKEILGVQVNWTQDAVAFQAGSDAVTADAGSVASQGIATVHSLVENLGLSGLDHASMGQMQVFWAVAAILLGLLTTGAVKLYQQV